MARGSAADAFSLRTVPWILDFTGFLTRLWYFFILSRVADGADQLAIYVFLVAPYNSTGTKPLKKIRYGRDTMYPYTWRKGGWEVAIVRVNNSVDQRPDFQCAFAVVFLEN